MMSDWELILQYIRLVIETSDLPRWGHYELIDVDNSFKLTDTYEDSDNEDLHNNLKTMNGNELLNNLLNKNEQLKSEIKKDLNDVLTRYEEKELQRND